MSDSLFVPLQLLFNVFFLAALLLLAWHRGAADRPAARRAGRGAGRRPGWLRRERRETGPEANAPAAAEAAGTTARANLEDLLSHAESREQALNRAGAERTPDRAARETKSAAVADLQARIARFRRIRAEGGPRAS